MVCSTPAATQAETHLRVQSQQVDGSQATAKQEFSFCGVLGLQASGHNVRQLQPKRASEVLTAQNLPYLVVLKLLQPASAVSQSHDSDPRLWMSPSAATHRVHCCSLLDVWCRACPVARHCQLLSQSQLHTVRLGPQLPLCAEHQRLCLVTKPVCLEPQEECSRANLGYSKEICSRVLRPVTPKAVAMPCRTSETARPRAVHAAGRTSRGRLVL